MESITVVYLLYTRHCARWFICIHLISTVIMWNWLIISLQRGGNWPLKKRLTLPRSQFTEGVRIESRTSALHGLLRIPWKWVGSYYGIRPVYNWLEVSTRVDMYNKVQMKYNNHFQSLQLLGKRQKSAGTVWITLSPAPRSPELTRNGVLWPCSWKSRHYFLLKILRMSIWISPSSDFESESSSTRSLNTFTRFKL